MTGAVSETYSSTQTTTVDGDATLSSPNFKIKGGSSEAASIITVAEGSIKIGEGTSDSDSDPVTIKSNVFGLTSFGAATETYSSTLGTSVTGAVSETYSSTQTTTVDGDATLSSPNFKIKGGSSEAASIITVAEGSIKIGEGTSDSDSDPVTIKSNVFGLTSFGAATETYSSTLGTSVTGAVSETYSSTLGTSVTGAVSETYSSTQTTTVDGDATLSSPNFKIKGGSSEAASIITVAEGSIKIGEGTSDSDSDPVTIKSNVFGLTSFGAATETYSSTLGTSVTGAVSETYSSTQTTTVDGDATLSSPNFKIKGGSSEAASIITVAEGSIKIGEGTSDSDSDPVTIKSNVFGLTSFGAATETYSSTLGTSVTGAVSETYSSTQTTTVDGDATLSSPNFKIKGGSSEAASIITVAEGSIKIGEGTTDQNSDPVTIKSNVFGLTSFGAATASAPSFTFTGPTDIDDNDFTGK